MKNIIYTKIQEKNKIVFDELYQQCLQVVTSKQELGQYLRELESEKSIFQYDNSYHDLNSYPDINGYAQWGINGLCWLDTQNTSNSFGISYNLSPKLTTIYNKRDCFYGHRVQGKLITQDDKSFMIVTDSQPAMDLLILATFDQAKNHWVILNANTGFHFVSQVENAKNGDINLFHYSNNTYSFKESIGNKADYGIETKLIERLGEITPAPVSEFLAPIVCNKKLDIPFYTIDSISTADRDDAIYIEKNTLGYTLYVAIADVSAYVFPGDTQDQHAQVNCTSTYLPHNVTHMLDRTLAERFCSLNVGETKTALVCEMQLNPVGDIISKDFYQAETTIAARLSYNDVDRIVEGNTPQESMIFKGGLVQKFTYLEEAPSIIHSLMVLEEFSQLKTRHQDKNYFTVPNPEFHLGEDGKIDYLYIEEDTKKSQLMVESAMLPTNIATAEFVYEKYPKFGMFRNQTSPLAQELPKPAFYDFNNEGHWGLQTEFYTHFTSPIRRYCDLIVHRLIKDIIYDNKPTYSNEQLNDIAQHMNLQQYKSKQFAIKAKNLLMPQYLEKLVLTGQLDTKLTVVDYSANGIVCRNSQLIDIFIPTFKLESYVTRAVNKLLLADEPSVEQKKQGIESLNETWDIFMQLGQFAWTDERKNAMYQFQKKQLNNKPRM